MIEQYSSLLNILEKIQIEILGILKDIDDTAAPSPFSYNATIDTLLTFTKTTFSKTPLKDSPRYHDLIRHLRFGVYYSSKKNNINMIASNLHDVVYIDLPEIRSWLLTYFNESIDEELLIRTQNLLQHNESTSAVRESFVLLSNRLRKAFNVSSSANDGFVLLDTVFKENRTVRYKTGSELSSKEKRDFKNLLSGMYALLRNDAAHEGDISIEAANAALSTINYVLKTLEI